MNFNTFHNDNWRLTLSNFPSLDGKLNLKIFEQFIKEVNIPEINVDIHRSDFKGSSINHPISRENDDLPTIAIDFKLTEDLENWIAAYNWAEMLRYAKTQEEIFRKTTIKTFDIEILNNHGNVVAILTFTNCILSSLGSLPLTFGATEEVTFPMLLHYEEFKYRKV